MTAYFSDCRKVGKKTARRGITMAIAMAAASLCLLGVLAGCTSSAAGFTEPEGTAAVVNEPGLGTVTAAVGSSAPSQSPILRCNYYTGKEFMASIEAAGRDGEAAEKAAGGTDSALYPADGSGRIAGGVTPHHLLAANLIAAFFRELSADPPDTIVIIGPNHKRIGFSGLHTSSSNWGTPFGRLEANKDIVKLLADNFNASADDRLMQEEHSISSLIPYIGYYMPEVRIVPILLHGNYPSADALKLGKYLGDLARDNGDILIIASVDFSHYLDAETAGKMDAITWDAIKSRDIQAIYKMGNDNLDSPPSIITLLGAMGEEGATGPEESGHTNSSEITGTGADYTTSYFTIFYRYADK